MKMTAQDIYQEAVGAGFSPSAAITMTAIALAESGGNPDAHNPNTGTGDNSYGLWQINMLGSMGPQRRRQLKLTSNNDLFNPQTNAAAALALSGGANFKPWTTYNTGAYRQYMGQAQAAAAGAGIVGAGARVGAQMSGGAGGSEGAQPTQQPFDAKDRAGQVLGSLAGDQSAASSDATSQPVSMPATPPPTTAQTPGSSAASAAVAIALKAVGVPYQWGGNSLSNGVDCSGLIQQAYKAAGIDLPRVSDAQIKAGTPVDPSSMQPGDVLGWVYNQKLNGGATHVAMYIGGGKMVEALHAGAPVHVVDVRTPTFVSRITGAVSNTGQTDTQQPQFSADDSVQSRLAAVFGTLSAAGSGQWSAA